MKISEKIIGAVAVAIAVAMLVTALPVQAKDEYREGENTVRTEVQMSPAIRGDDALIGILSVSMLKYAVLPILFPDPVSCLAAYLLVTSVS